MDVHPLLGAVEEGGPHQGIGDALAQLRIAHDLAQLGVQKRVLAGPVDAGMGIGEVEGHQLGKGVLEDGLPGIVDIVVRCGGAHRRSGCGLGVG